MAHGDYECCAICDCKMQYVGLNEKFKTDICSECRERNNISTVKQFIEMINTFDDDIKLTEWLKDIGFSYCFYSNDVDCFIEFKLTGEPTEKFNSSVVFLSALGCI